MSKIPQSYYSHGVQERRRQQRKERRDVLTMLAVCAAVLVWVFLMLATMPPSAVDAVGMAADDRDVLLPESQDCQ